jgi:hypothetical protein
MIRLPLHHPRDRLFIFFFPININIGYHCFGLHHGLYPCLYHCFDGYFLPGFDGCQRHCRSGKNDENIFSRLSNQKDENIFSPFDKCSALHIGIDGAYIIQSLKL